MIDMVNYKRAIEWLKRSIAEHTEDPKNQTINEGLLHSFEVTYNVTESILREALGHLSDDPLIPGLSSRELMRFAADEGLTLSSPKAWLEYGLAVERAKHPLEDRTSAKDILSLLPQYTGELEAFATRLEARLVPVAA